MSGGFGPGLGGAGYPSRVLLGVVVTNSGQSVFTRLKAGSGKW